jgi:hypothetical protein
MKSNKFPQGWNEERLKKVLVHYENQSEDDAVSEDEAVFEKHVPTVMQIPKELVPIVRELIAKHQA